MNEKINLLDCSLQDLKELLTSMGEPAFRAGQIFQWLSKGVKEPEEMSNLSKELRMKLGEVSTISHLKIFHKLVSAIDGTAKYLFRLEDGQVIESVLMSYKHGLTACISSQVGCKMGCSFCASTGIGFVRNLSPGEMLDQILAMQTDEGKRIGNIVVMGIGEPLDNYENLLKFMRLAQAPEGLNIGYRHMTVSTCGLVPKIRELAAEGMPINLSISLHAPNDELRSRMMPVNRNYCIDEIIKSCKYYIGMTKRRITFEYAMISGINDSHALAVELARRIKGMLCHVNLIPVNDVKDTGYKKSGREKMAEFQRILTGYGIETTIRREMGSDIQAACGQLRRSSMTGQ